MEGTQLQRALHVRVHGNGPRVVLLSQTLGLPQSAWRSVLPHLMDLGLYRIVVYDHVCSGTVNPALYDHRRYASLESYADDMLRVLDSLRIQSCVFVGHSVSAMIGMLVAIRRPQIFRRLLLLDASPRFLNEPAAYYSGGFSQAHMWELFRAIEMNCWFFTNRGANATLAVADDMPEAIRDFSRPFFNMDPFISRHVCWTVFNTDLRGMLGNVTASCVLVRTLGTGHMNAAFNYLVHSLGGFVDVIFMPDHGHFPRVNIPEFVALLQRVL